MDQAFSNAASHSQIRDILSPIHIPNNEPLNLQVHKAALEGPGDLGTIEGGPSVDTQQAPEQRSEKSSTRMRLKQ